MIKKVAYTFYRIYQKSLYFLLKSKNVRFMISYIRAFIYINILRRMNKYDVTQKKHIHEHTVFSNLRRIIKNKDNPHPKAKYFLGIDLDQYGEKSRLLMNPIMSIHHIKEKVSSIKVLIIGPRVESEILSIMSYGIPSKNITSIDLISYSPWIDLGDMHELPYDDNIYDLIICGWVIAYSNDKSQVAKEIIRVSKTDAIVAIGVTYSPLSNDEVIKARGYLIGSPERLESTKMITTLFKNNLNKVYFANDAYDKEKKSKIISVFSIKK